ncbi:DNA mismatch repair protein MutL isoform 1 [Galdieria sulphuraria]|uniref:DNA mismatch repair protein MutL isoform 1 n=1 Tax=Galdieria sulphuraria TaxID=130081 RepID=M2XX25_GALSU|nr:DNA mismatch repair protein MutL isoform 1 [Galdieria sulphuraria]EME27969.1 DNA mismatch repair protein MutL isoform 1 [Galdieria sulphuraria]|eukprot:XP_005704489.1 DNA mismatch repair protein MutL isoform 1 [Galdieria sulphuraria]
MECYKLLFVWPIGKSPLQTLQYAAYSSHYRSFRPRYLVRAQQEIGASHQVRPLTRQVIEKIHSDEIIRSPVDVVRELLDNAIDAQANIITVEWQEDKRRRIRVIDNGMGMSLANLELCIQSHTTSKIASLDDLHHMNTLGFRGQALWAIAIYCESLCISSRPASEWVGYRLEYSNHLSKHHIVPVSQDMGTCVQVSLHEAATGQHEKQIRNLFQRYALIYPKISFRLRKNIHERRPYIVYSKCRHLLERVVQVLPIPSNELRYHQVKLEQQQGNPIGHIQVIIGLPERIHRARNDWMWTSINGRILEQSIFQELIMAKTKKMIPSGRYPLCFVLIELKPTYVIWDFSPKKLDVQIKPCIQQELQKNISYCIDRALDVSDALYKETDASEWTNDRFGYPEKVLSQQSCDHFQKWKVVGQLKKTYIVVETDSSVLLLEQHVAHEGVLFEKLCELWRSKPEFLSFCSLPSSLLLQGVPQICIERLQQLHIHARSLDGMLTWTIDELPKIIFDMLHHNDSCEAQLMRIANPQRNLEDNLADFACRCAWNNGKELTQFQMDRLVDQWMHLKGNKRTCPHGRPIFIQLHDNYLSRLFKRTWFPIEKS